MNGFRLYLRYIANGLRAQMLYPTAFSLRLITQFVITITEFGGLYALFSRFGHIRGWTFPEIALFYGVVSVSFALADTTCRGFDLFGSQFVKTGDFDRVLLRPRTATLQLMGFEFGFTSLGRVLQGLIALAVGIALLHIDWTAGQVASAAWAMAGGCALFFAILLLQATLSFWTVESLEARQHHHLWRHRGGAISARHLRRLVPQIPDLCRAARLRRLFSRRRSARPLRHDGASRLGRRADAAGGLRLHGGRVPGLERRRAALHQHGQLETAESGKRGADRVVHRRVRFGAMSATSLALSSLSGCCQR